MNTSIEISSPQPLAVGTTDLLMLDDALLTRMMKLAEFMATGKSTLPRHYRGNPGDCLAVIMQSAQWRMNPYAVAQKTFFVNDAIGYEGQLWNAVIQSVGAIEGDFDYEWFGPWERVIGKFEIRKGDKGEYRVPGWKLADEDGIGIRIGATRHSDQKRYVLELLLAQCRVRNSPLWADDPKQQIAYLAIRKWGRLYTPAAILGLGRGREDIDEESGERFMGQAEVVGEPAAPSSAEPTSRAKQLKERMKKKAPDAPVILADVLTKIDSADSAEALKDAARMAVQLENEAEKETARKRYSTRQEALKGATNSPPPPLSTENPTEGAVEFSQLFPTPTPEHARSAIQRREFDLAADLIRSFEPDIAKGLTEELYKAIAADKEGGNQK